MGTLGPKIMVAQVFSGRDDRGQPTGRVDANPGAALGLQEITPMERSA